MTKSKPDHTRALIKASLALTPYVGGAIASLIEDYIPSATERSKDRAWELLAERLDKIEHRIDPEAVDKDEFAELFKSCYLTIVRSHREEKLKAATAIFANILLREADPEKLTYAELDHFARCAETLSSGAVEVLANVVHVARPEGPVYTGRTSHRMSFGELNSRVPEYSPELLMGLVAELDRANLVHRVSGVIEMADYINYEVRLTPLGERFSQFLLD